MPNKNVSRSRHATWKDFRGTGLFLLCAGGIGIFAANGQTSIEKFTAFLMAIAPAACGIFVGFLYGMPRAPAQSHAADGRQVTNAEESPSAEKPSSATASAQTAPSANTNLEEIADWLTKVLVGAGLTQIGKLPDALEGMAGRLVNKTDLKSVNVIPTVISIWLYFAIWGFFVGYLMTRLFLVRQLAIAGDESLLTPIVADLVDHAAKQTASNLQSGEPTETLTEQSRQSAGLPLKSVIWVEENPIQNDAERAKFISLKIHLVECTPDQAKQFMQEKSFDGAVFAYHLGVNSEQNIVDLLSQTVSLVPTGRLVAFGKTDDQANLDAKVKSAGGAGATSSLPDLLALLGLGA